MSTPERPDIIVNCDHGVEDGPKDFVQRFEWRDGVWLPKDITVEKYSNVGGPEGPFASADDIADAPRGRWHLNTRCGSCWDKVPMEWNRGQAALTRLWAELAKPGSEERDTGEPLRLLLAHLRMAYRNTPRLS